MDPFVLLLIISLLVQTVTVTWGFIVPSTAFHGCKRYAASSTSTRHRRIFSVSRDEEIADLEARLRKLKEEADAAGEGSEGQSEDAPTPVADRRILEKVRGKDMILSERELVEEQLLELEAKKGGDDAVGDDGEGGGLVKNALIAVAAIVFLFFFAQVPVGQEQYTKYSATGSSSVQTIDLGDLNTDAPRKL